MRKSRTIQVKRPWQLLVAALFVLPLLTATAGAFTMEQDTFEPDNTVAEAKPLVLGAAKQVRTLHYTPETGGDVDWVSFSATAGAGYIIQTHDLDPNTTDTVLELYAPDGSTLLAENDDFGFSFASRIAWKAPQTGTYYAKVRGRHSGVSGSYTLTLRQAGALTGQVLKQGTTKPLAGITVDLWQFDYDGYYAQYETTTDGEGRYTFDAVPVGTWRVGFFDTRGVFAGKYYLNRTSVEQGSDVSVSAGATTTGIDVTLAALPKTFIEVEGANRYATAVKASQVAYPGKLPSMGERTVFIATGRNWPDALGGTALAGVLGGPVLLVDTQRVPSVVMDEIRRLDADKAVILGGVVAVEPTVESALVTELGTGSVRRISGSNRYRTADEIAKEVIALQGSGFGGVALVATGANYPDALAAASLAAARGMPLFLADPKNGLRAETKVAMDGVSSVIILGGVSAVSSSVETYLVGRFGRENVERLGGGDRYGTAVRIARHGVEERGMKWDRMGVATGGAFPDALSGGVMLGTRNAVLLLTRSGSLPDVTRQALTAAADEVAVLHFIGGPTAVSTSVRTEVTNALK